MKGSRRGNVTLRHYYLLDALRRYLRKIRATGDGLVLPCRISSKGWKVRRALLARPSSLSLAPAPPPAIAAQSHDEALSDASLSLLEPHVGIAQYSLPLVLHAQRLIWKVRPVGASRGRRLLQRNEVPFPSRKRGVGGAGDWLRGAGNDFMIRTGPLSVSLAWKVRSSLDSSDALGCQRARRREGKVVESNSAVPNTDTGRVPQTATEVHSAA